MEQRQENEAKLQRYNEIREEYKTASKQKMLYTYVFGGIIMLLFTVNKVFRLDFISPAQYILLALALIAFGIGLILQHHYQLLLKDRLSILSMESEIAETGRPTTQLQRLAINRKTLYNNASFYWIGLVLLLLSALLWLRTAAEPEDKIKNPVPLAGDGKICIDLIQVNDVYEITALEQGKSGGMARIASYKKEWQSKNSNTLLLIAGDFLSPSVFNTIKKDTTPVAGKQMIDAMNAAGFDLAIFGNHEFDVKEKLLQACIDASNFQWIASNVFREDSSRTHFKQREKDIPETWVRDFTDKDGTAAKIGFISVTLNKNQAGYVQYDTTIDNIEKRYKELEKSCDAIIAITHQDMEQDIALAKQLPGLAAILGGHEHDMQFTKVGNVYITKAHSNARSAFHINIEIDKTNHTCKVVPELKYLDSSVSKDALTDAVAQKWIELAEDSLIRQGFDVKGSVSEIALDAREKKIGTDSNNDLGRLIVNAMEDVFPKVKLAVFNAGSVRVDEILKPPVTQYDIVRSLPFGGGIIKAGIKGDMLLLMLEAGSKNRGSGGFLHYSASLCKKEDGWYIGKAKIDPSAEYLLAMSQYLAEGREQNLNFLKGIRVIDDRPVSPGLSSDIRLAVITYMKKSILKNQRK